MTQATLQRNEAVAAKAASIDADLAEIGRKAKAAYEAAVIKVASGQSLPAAEIQAACIGCGRTIDQFQAAVNVVRRRAEALETVNKLKEQQAEIDKLYHVAGGIMQAIRDADAEHSAKRQTLSNQYVLADQQYQSASNAEAVRQQNAAKVLRETAANPDGDLHDLGNVKID